MTTHQVGVAFAGAGFLGARPKTLAHRAARDGGLYTVELWPRRLSDALDETWDFRTALPDGWTLARASAGTYWQAAGSPDSPVLATATSGTPRFDHDPLTGAARGLLLEPQRTNLITRSAELDHADWTKIGGMTVTANAAAAPDGSATADLVSAGTSTFGGVLRTNPAIAQNTTYTLSVFAKAGTHRYVGLRLPDNLGTANAGNQYTAFDLVAGAWLVQPDIYVVARAEALPGGWWRLSITGTTPAVAVSTLCDFALTEADGNINYAPGGSPTPALYLWGAQLEAGGFPTSYVATTSAAATRVADTLALDDASAWSGAEGTIGLQGALAGIEAGFVGLFSFDDGTVANHIDVTYDGNQFLLGVNGTNQGFLSVADGVAFTVALRWAVGRQGGARDGSAAAEHTFVAAAPACDRVVLGRLYDDSGVAAWWLKRLTATNRFVADRDLTYLSANGVLPPRVPTTDQGGGIHHVALAETGYASDAADAVGQVPFDPTLDRDAFAMVRSLIDGDDVGGLARVDVSEIRVVNAAGDFDQLHRDFAPDGRRWRVRVGRAGRAHDAFATVMEGAIERWSIDEARFGIAPRDWSALLDVVAQTKRYSGAGGLEGGEDLRDRPKPLLLGYRRNITAPLVDPVNLIWQLTAGPPGKAGCIRDVTVYDNAVAFSSAFVAVNRDAGTVQLLTDPAGAVTFDAEGGVVEAGSPTVRTWPGSVADIVRILLDDCAGIDAAQIDDQAFALAAADAGGRPGLWIGPEERLVRDAVEACVRGISGWLAPDRRRAFRLGVYQAPGSVLTAPHRLTEAEIETIEPIDPPSALWPPARRVRAAYRRNETLQVDGIAFDADRIEFLKNEWRYTAVETTAATEHLLARDPPAVETLVDERAHAEIVLAARRLLVAPTGPGRLQRAFRVRLAEATHDIEFMDDVAVFHSRFNLVGGAVFKAVEIAERTGDAPVELILLR